VRSEYAANQTINTATHFTNAWTPAANGVDGVKIGRSFTMAAPGGRTVSAELSAAMGRQAAGKLLARALGVAVPLVGTGLLAYEVYDAVRVRENPTGDGLRFDPGTAAGSSSVNVKEWRDNAAGDLTSNPWNESLSGACQVSIDLRPFCANSNSTPGKSGCSTSLTGAGTTGDPNRCFVTYTYFAINDGTCDNDPGTPKPTCFQTRNDVRDLGVRTVAKTKPTCGGVVTTSFDGRCPTGQYGETITPEEAESKRRLAEDAGKMPRLTEAQLAQAISEVVQQIPVPIHDDYRPQVADVPDVAGATTTTTSADGTTKTEAIAWDFEPYGLTKGFGYAASGAWDKETTTTTCPGGGTQCTTETETQSTDGQTEGDTAEESDAVDFCKGHPERAGCVELGDMPTDEVPRTSLALAYSAETISLPSGCPPDVVLPRGQVFSYATACDAATLARPLVIAAAAVTALWICVAAVGGTRGSA